MEVRRREELERLFLSRKHTITTAAAAAASAANAENPTPAHLGGSLYAPSHSPQRSISDDSYHVTETIGSWYEEPAISASDSTSIGIGMGDRNYARPLSYINSPSERESFEARRQRRHGALLDGVSNTTTTPRPPPTSTTSFSRPSPPGTAHGRAPLPRAYSNEQSPPPTAGSSSLDSSRSLQRKGSSGTDSRHDQNSPTCPPPLSRQSSTDTAVQQFPLNDIDYESSPAAVAQELSNLQAIRRMSMNVDTADPDLPSFGGISSISSVAPSTDDDEDDPSKLFWVPARLHPELAPKEFKTFIEDRVDRIRRRSGDENSLSPEGLSRSGSGESSLRRKKSMLSHSIDTRGNYQDGAERLERKRSKGMQLEGQTTVANLQDLEELVDDPAQLMRRMSLETSRRSLDSGVEVPANEDMPILPPAMGTLKRSTRTTYRRGSLKKGERMPYSKRAAQRQTETDHDNYPPTSPAVANVERHEPTVGLARVRTEPIPPPKDARNGQTESRYDRGNQYGQSHSSEDLVGEKASRASTSPPPKSEQDSYDDRPVSQPPSSQQPRQFQSRIASPGRTTAQLPGYDNKNPLPQIVETLPDGSRVPVNTLAQSIPERKSSHEVPRQFQRGGAHTRPVPGRQNPPSSKLDDLSSNPSPLPGSGGMGTDSLTMIPTFEEKKAEKKDGPRKSSWKWILGSDDKSKEDNNADSAKSSKSSKLSKNSTDKARLDVLQNSIDGTVPVRGRESVVLNREDIKLEEERRKDGKKSESSKKEKDKESGLLSAIFGNKKKTSDGDLKERKRKGDRHHSPEPPPRILKPDIDYNWTRFSILEERAIYRMAHIKLANPRRALYSQVLLSNFMYSYLAKVQMMHPQMQIPAQRTAQQREQQQKQQQQQQQQPPEYNQYQRWQEEQARQDATNAASETRTSFDAVHEGQRDQSSASPARRASADEYGRPLSKGSRENARANGSPGGNSSSNGYKVANAHDYLGYQKSTQSHDHHNGLWNDDEKEEELW
ncbi:Putative protein Zds1 [Septoria linicola]|uniref:Protein Zds1 C-terminal domain-containing protein n=1 Tax=Septoria linicola TaxID=215465 RepID=A0A9Q9EDC2_9PEZI|nr:putative protein Zds1 [Septoria linicola]USW47626.1 Putative protein Zds1 [Septoria linicola]